MHQTTLPVREAAGDATKSVRRRCVAWRVGGQSLTKVDNVAGEFDVLLHITSSRNSSCCCWMRGGLDRMLYMGPHQWQWRGVGIGLSHDICDSWTDRISFVRGAAWVIRLQNNRRVIFGSVHLPTGVSTATYHGAVQKFRKALLRWHPELPCCIGVDVNEVVKCTAAEEDEHGGEIPLSAGAKLDNFLEASVRRSPPNMPP